MAMQLTIPEDLQALIERRLETGAYNNAEDVLRQALEAQDADAEEWTAEEREEVSARLEESYQQAVRGELFSEGEVRQHLAEYKQQWLKARQG